MHACVCYLWLGSMVVRGTSGCEAAEPVAWLEKRRCAITLGKKASCSLTTLGILMESSVGGDGVQFKFLHVKREIRWKVKIGMFLTLFIILIGAAERVLGGLA